VILDTMNGTAAATTERINGLASPSSKPVDGTNGHADVSAASDDHEEESDLEEEVQDLKDDRTYHDFIHNVVEHKEIAEEDETVDGDFVVEQEKEGEDGDQQAAQPDGDASEDGDESTLTDFEDDDDDEKVGDPVESAAAAGDGLEVKIPLQSIKEASARFPHFWRTKHAIKTEYREGDYAEDQDPDYEPENDKEAANLDDTQDEETADAALATAGDDWRQTDEQELESDQEKDEFEEEEEDPEAMKAELDDLQAEKEKDLTGDVDGLVEMVEYMTVVNPATESGSAASPADVADNAASEQQEEGSEGEDMETAQTIGELELDGYVSAEDPDFPEPSKDDFDAASDSQPDSDDEMTVERTE